MCGIVGAIAQRDVGEILLEGLKRLEYRGYDSAGLAIQGSEGIQRLRRLGKVQELADAYASAPLSGHIGVAHTRWATHGDPSERNAHPHISSGNIAVVHNGIIENHEQLREELQNNGYKFESDTDTEVIAHLLHKYIEKGRSLLEAVHKVSTELDGAYGAAVMDARQPDRLVVARSGSPLVIGKGIGEYFVASDQLALLPVTREFIYLEEGEVAEVTRDGVTLLDAQGAKVKRDFEESDVQHDAGSKGQYRHFMLKEIYEQPKAVADTLEGRITENTVLVESFGAAAPEIFEKIETVQIVACGTSYHAGLVAKYWFEQWAGISCQVDIASEYRYRRNVVRPNSLFVTISQSGETADTMGALRQAKEQGFLSTLTICNVAGSSMVRESQLVFMTRAGTEIGVASTKAFTAQLTGLALLVAALAKCRGADQQLEREFAQSLMQLPGDINNALKLAEPIEAMAEDFAEMHNALFLGRGDQYPIAMEGALKLKEISYIHAEAYAAGELKHGPLALIDHEMPVIVVAPNNELLEKLKSNMEVVRARGGRLYVFASAEASINLEDGIKMLRVDSTPAMTAPIVYTVPLQLLSYYVAIIKGTDVDQPRNLAKSVTVE